MPSLVQNTHVVFTPHGEEYHHHPGDDPIDAATIESQRAEFGAPDWYEWSKQNWGTKWGTYQLEAFDLGGDGAPICLKFQSAWSSPCVEVRRLITAHLKSRYGFENVVFIGFDPYDDTTIMLKT